MQEIQVAVGIILDGQGNVFISKRKSNAHFGGLWEFPGGKLEQAESYEAALARELKEEVGIEVTESIFFMEKEYVGQEKRIALKFYLIKKFEGQPQSNEEQQVSWVAIKDLDPTLMPPINNSVIEKLQLLA